MILFQSLSFKWRKSSIIVAVYVFEMVSLVAHNLHSIDGIIPYVVYYSAVLCVWKHPPYRQQSYVIPLKGDDWPKLQLRMNMFELRNTYLLVYSMYNHFCMVWELCTTTKLSRNNSAWFSKMGIRPRRGGSKASSLSIIGYGWWRHVKFRFIEIVHTICHGLADFTDHLIQ